jgi:ribosomal protein S18 acetylase RimI-like enzyme
MIAVPQSPLPDITIRQAGPADLDQVAVLFDLYRQFYGQPANFDLARDFLCARIERMESIILLASRDGRDPTGFAQLYPTFCSVSAAPIFVLYDLYVDASVRREGIGRALMHASVEHARRAGAVRVELATAITNDAAQALYEASGWVRDNAFYRYSLMLR